MTYFEKNTCDRMYHLLYKSVNILWIPGHSWEECLFTKPTMFIVSMGILFLSDFIVRTYYNDIFEFRYVV